MNIRRFDKWDDMIEEENRNITAANAEKEMLNSEKQQVLNDYINNYNNQMATLDTLNEQQNNIADQYKANQEQILKNNYESNTNTIEQNRKETQENINKEKKDSYIDYMKQINQYGGAAEQLASQGLATTGYAESSKVAMYNTYQNRVSAANTALTKANVEYDRQMQEAKNNYDVGLAQLALDTMQQKYTIALQGFEYKNTLFNNKTNFELQVNDSYWNKGQTLQNRIDNYRNTITSILQNQDKMAEEKRQFDEQMAEKKREYDTSLAEEQRQFNQQMSYKNSSGGGGYTNYGGYSDNPTYTSGGNSAAAQLYNAASNTGNAVGGMQQVKIKNGSLKLSNNVASTYINNFLKQYGGKSISISQLESILNTYRNKGIINDSDYKKVANYFGLNAE